MTREEAARILEKQFDKSCGNYRYQNKDKLDYEDALWMAISSLRELEAQEKQKPFGEWISVKDRLPENCDGRVQCVVCVLCSYRDAFGEPCDEKVVIQANYDCNQKIWNLDFEEWKEQLNALIDIDDAPEEGDYITHWMPLPEPPKEEVNGVD
ncbi:MAG: hypothetical protein DBX63_06655 [Clostridia bacterium]|nr:MAG: hypothetical protein DBX63_06655 [Clostridia bacterium]